MRSHALGALLLLFVHDAIADETFVPRTLVETDDIPLDGEDSTDAGAALVKSGAYAELRQVAERRDASFELRANAALTYLLEGDLTTADIVLSHLARWCRTKWTLSLIHI